MHRSRATLVARRVVARFDGMPHTACGGAPQRRSSGTTYTVRWSVNGRRHGEAFKTAASADSFRAVLLVAANNGEPFDQDTGRPTSHAASAAEVTWYDFALRYVDMKWSRISANNRISTAKALTKATLALLRAEPTQYDPVDVRKALREYAFNKNRRDEPPPSYEPSSPGFGATRCR
ncbi:hypothetical protein [Streptomyces sp. C10]|uniref:hypothetical protein n=1 Tax=Streptomyces sp. C10 TaxID=531941 RepID=UPI00397F9273